MRKKDKQMISKKKLLVQDDEDEGNKIVLRVFLHDKILSVGVIRF